MSRLEYILNCYKNALEGLDEVKRAHRALMKCRTKYVIAIDPDVEKSGVVLLRREDKSIQVMSLTFWEIITHIVMWDHDGKDFFVVVEGGWLNHGNWHLPRNASPAKAAAMGRNVGMNHQTGILLTQVLEGCRIPYEVVKPLRKCWRGKDGKITAKELAYFTGYTKRTNQDERDAILLAWNAAGFPIRVAPLGSEGKEGG